jgi:negative regulator of sigma E activity
MLLNVLSTLAISAQDSSVTDIVARMMERDHQRQSELRGYTSTRRYVLVNEKHHKRAEMTVKLRCLEDGSKQFETISASGWSAARSHVFPRLLEGEREASLPGARDRSRITPENYSFDLVGTDVIEGHAAYVIEVTPKAQNKYLIHGRIWVDREDYAIMRIEGMPAKPPSFWVKSVHFVHSYYKTGSFWFPSSDRSLTNARIVGNSELTIEYFDYTPDVALTSTGGSR